MLSLANGIKEADAGLIADKIKLYAYKEVNYDETGIE